MGGEARHGCSDEQRAYFQAREAKKKGDNGLFWRDVKVAKHVVNQQKLMDGRKKFSSTWTPYLQRTTLMLLLGLTGLDTKIYGQ